MGDNIGPLLPPIDPVRLQTMPARLSLSGHQDQWRNCLIPLRQLYRRDRPPAFVTSNRNPQPMRFIEPQVVHRPSLSIRQDDGLPNKFDMRLIEFSKDRRRSCVGGWHGLAPDGLN